MLKNNGFHNRHSPILRAFSPRSLFASGAPGAWYDPSDLTTLFQDSAGTTPVTAVEQPVGLMLDKSQGLVLGPELVVNGDFSNGTTGWATFAATGSATLTQSAGVATLTNPVGSTYSTAYQAFSTTVGRTYKVVCDFVQTTTTVAAIIRKSDTNNSGANTITIYGGNPPIAPKNGAVGFFTATATTTYILAQVNGDNATVSFDNISVKELPGNHAFQSTSASRPVLSARYNLLTKTEDFSDAVWLLASGLRAFGSGSIANTTETTDPLGGNTADKLVEISGAITSAGLGLAASSVPASSGVQYTATVYAKASGRRYAALFANGVPSGAGAYFDLQDGVVTTIGANNLARSIVSAGNGWWKLSITFLTTTGAAGFSFNLSENGTTNTYTGNGTSGIYIWGASLVPTNQSTLPYQRVNTATDYDTTGFKPYLKFDGVDDSLSTNSISFTSTDKMSVFAGVRKLSDAAAAIFTELGSGSLNGSFYISAPEAGATYGIRTRGTTDQTGYNHATFTAPLTNVIATSLNNGGAGGTAANCVTSRFNGVVNTTGATPSVTGTGNFGNYPLYIGRRNNASLPFNGQLYSMIVVGKAVTAGELTSTETYVNQKTGAY